MRIVEHTHTVCHHVIDIAAANQTFSVCAPTQCQVEGFDFSTFATTLLQNDSRGAFPSSSAPPRM